MAMDPFQRLKKSLRKYRYLEMKSISYTNLEDCLVFGWSYEQRRDTIVIPTTSLHYCILLGRRGERGPTNNIKSAQHREIWFYMKSSEKVYTTKLNPLVTSNNRWLPLYLKG